MENNNRLFTKKIEANISKIDEVIDYVIDCVSFLNLPNKIVNCLRICVEEVFVNIASYAYENAGEATVIVEVNEEKISITFIDNGKKFNPLEKDDPNIMASPEERGIGGLGIFMVKQMMDEVFYNYENKQNKLTLVKNVNSL